MSFEFWVTTLLVTITPGTGAIFTIATGLARGARASMVAAVGCTLGIVPHLAAALSGVALLVATSRVAFEVLRWAGVVYLLWLAVATWRDRSAVSVGEVNTAPSNLHTIGTAVFINLLNPKLTLFFFAFLPQFVQVESSPKVAMLVLGAAFMAVTLVVFLCYGLAAASVRDLLLRRPRVMTGVQRALALSLVALSARLAVASA